MPITFKSPLKKSTYLLHNSLKTKCLSEVVYGKYISVGLLECPDIIIGEIVAVKINDSIHTGRVASIVNSMGVWVIDIRLKYSSIFSSDALTSLSNSSVNSFLRSVECT